MTVDKGKFAHCVLNYPVRHKRKVPFGPRLVAPQRLADRLARVQGLDRELNRLVIPREDLLSLASEAFSSNIHYSSKIEGNPLTLEQVTGVTREPFRGVTPRPSDRPEQEVLNHLIAFLDPSFFIGQWTLSTIKSLHELLTSDLGEVAHPGEFRHRRSAVKSDRGEETFLTCPPEYIAEELQSLLDWLKDTGPTLNPAVAATVFFHEFESIHPFDDGNGRTGRVLFHGYLQTHGFTSINVCEVEREMLQDPQLYYRILGWTDLTGQYTELIDFVADALVSAYEDAVRRFGERDVLRTGVNETTRRILERARQEREWFDIKTAAEWVPRVSEQTIRNHLNALVTRGVLQSKGKTKAKRYRFSASLRTTLEFVRQHARPGPTRTDGGEDTRSPA